MIELLKMITTTLRTAHERVYKEIAPQDATFPYVVYRLPTSNDTEGREDFILEIDIWDNNTNTTALETLTESIDRKLNRFKYVDSKLSACSYRINRMMIPDPDTSIKRRQLRYEIKTYFLKEE